MRNRLLAQSVLRHQTLLLIVGHRHVLEKAGRPARRSPDRPCAGHRGHGRPRRGWLLPRAPSLCPPARAVGRQRFAHRVVGGQLGDELLAGLAVAADRPWQIARPAGDSRWRPTPIASRVVEHRRHARPRRGRPAPRRSIARVAARADSAPAGRRRPAWPPALRGPLAATGCAPNTARNARSGLERAGRHRRVASRSATTASICCCCGVGGGRAQPFELRANPAVAPHAQVVRRSRRACQRSRPRRPVSSRFRKPAAPRRRFAGPRPSVARTSAGAAAVRSALSSSAQAAAMGGKIDPQSLPAGFRPVARASPHRASGDTNGETDRSPRPTALVQLDFAQAGQRLGIVGMRLQRLGNLLLSARRAENRRRDSRLLAR